MERNIKKSSELSKGVVYVTPKKSAFIEKHLSSIKEEFVKKKRGSIISTQISTSSFDKLSNSLKIVRAKIEEMVYNKKKKDMEKYTGKPKILQKSREIAEAKSLSPLFTSTRIQKIQRERRLHIREINRSVNFEKEIRKTREQTPKFTPKANKRQSRRTLSLLSNPKSNGFEICSKSGFIDKEKKECTFTPKISKNSRKLAESVRVFLDLINRKK